MADVRCPMCGKPNSDELEVCQFCQARLKPLRIDSPIQAEEMPGEPQKAPEITETSVPDWLSGLRQGPIGDLGVEGIEREQEPFSEVPDDLEAVKEEPDWLDRLGQAEDKPSPPSPSPTEPAVPDVTGANLDWLSALEKSTPAVESVETPQWFTQESSEREAPEGEIPDWLSGPESQVGTPLEGQPGAEKDVEGAESVETSLPIWLADLRKFSPETPEQEISDEAAPSGVEPVEASLPEWLSGIELRQPETPPVADAPVHEETKEPILPDWISDLKSQEPGTPVSSATPEMPAKDETALPDWLGSLTVEEPEELIPTQAEMPFPEETLSGVEQEETLAPDWLVETGVEAPEQPSAEPEEVYLPPDEGTELPALPVESELEWLKNLEAAFPEPDSEALSGETGLPPFAMTEQALAELAPVEEGSLPEWMQDEATEQAIETLPAEPEAKEEEIQPGSLPSWLEAMRPVSTVGVGVELSEEAAALVEGAGPLAGLAGLLPAEPDMASSRKPTAYSVKLQVDDLQQSRTELLEQMIKAEGEARPASISPLITSQHILRAFIFIFLLAAMVSPLFPGVPQLAMPMFTPETFATSQLIDGLPAGAVVMLAIDYQPGFSGELDKAAGAVVDHLILKGSFLTLVSTVPMGPVQAERLLANVNLIGAHAIHSPDQYVNLGYVPGGPAGLLGFALDPRQVLPLDVNGGLVWQNQALQNIKSLADFALVIVVTENPDTARAWIEQVQPNLADTPLVMIISAQAEPIVRPYYDANPRQVQGMLSGLSAAASYEALQGRSGSASSAWTPYSIGAIAAAFLIVIGGGVNIISALLARRKTEAKS